MNSISEKPNPWLSLSKRVKCPPKKVVQETPRKVIKTTVKRAPTLSPIPSESEDDDDDDGTVYIGWGELKRLR